MNGRQAKKLRRQVRRQAKVYAQERMDQNLRDRLQPEIKPWFRLYLKLARLREKLGIPIPQERISEKSKTGVRLVLSKD